MSQYRNCVDKWKEPIEVTEDLMKKYARISSCKTEQKLNNKQYNNARARTQNALAIYGGGFFKKICGWNMTEMCFWIFCQTQIFRKIFFFSG